MRRFTSSFLSFLLMSTIELSAKSLPFKITYPKNEETYLQKNSQLFLEKSPFEINFPSKMDLTHEDYIEIQNQIRSIDIYPLIRKLYRTSSNIKSVDDFYRRSSRSVNQTFIDPENGLYPQKELIKIGEGGDRCFVCFVSYNGKYPYYVKSFLEALQEGGFNGYLLYYIGGWPNPTGEEIRYAAVPYSFKIFAMMEAYLSGFNQVIWVDSACYPLRDVEPLFDLLEKRGALFNIYNPWPEGFAFILPHTRSLLLNLTGTDVLNSPYINSTIFGLKMDTPEAQSFIKTYYQCVQLGTPFLSCFPEEWVFTAILGRKEFREWISRPRLNYVKASLIDAEDSLEEFDKVRKLGFYFYQRRGR